MRSFKQVQIILATAGLALSLTACEVTTSGGYGGGGGGGGGTYDPYKHAWYDVYGNQCTSYGAPMPGCNFFADGEKITDVEDPNYNYSYSLYYDYWTYTDSYGYRQTYLGYAWFSGTGILYDEYGTALNEVESNEQSADVISKSAKKENLLVKKVGKAFAQKYALAEEAGVSVAKTLQDWSKLGKERARTDADVSDFSVRLYGVDQSKAQAAVLQAVAGSSDALDELNVDVAAHWGTSPETSKSILKNWYKDELSALNVK